jgi:hypothetical protein
VRFADEEFCDRIMEQLFYKKIMAGSQTCHDLYALLSD